MDDRREYRMFKAAVLGPLVQMSRVAEGRLPSITEVRELVEKMTRVFDVSSSEAAALIREIEARHGVTIDDGSVLKTATYRPWLDAARADIDWYYWRRYERLLSEEKHFPPRVVAGLDGVTDRVLGLLENPPRDGDWDRRGMVIGQVQSGKTANYLGLCCKAADAGYRVISVIAGLHNSLRMQTQRRLDEGLVGFDSVRILNGRTRRLGVGEFDFSRQPSALTTSLGDFDRQIAEKAVIPLANSNEPWVFVIKKNAMILDNLVKWLAAHNRHRGVDRIDEPMLLIDDEADNASINIGRRDEVSRINGLVRGLLGMFTRSSYIGYTATPFANIFIDPEDEDEMLGDDLFPRDFIVSLDPPNNYFGPGRLFGAGSGLSLQIADDFEALLPLDHKIDWRVAGLPKSLEQALRVFLLARAIRLCRGQAGVHNSMMVNVSRFLNVQGQVRALLHERVTVIRQSLSVSGGLPARDVVAYPEIRALHDVFRQQYAGSCGVGWPDVFQRLHESVSAVQVIEVNSRAADPLDYLAYEETGLNVIAVGGFSLSRGLTLEGLTVSYFLRNSVMYDTLMQMGRWFGYRDGYDDLCRVWMPEEAAGWYGHISESIDELREDLARMQRMNATPKDFGLRVRSHPDSLTVTARNKMGSGQKVRVRIGLANSFVETTTLRADRRALEDNLQAAIGFARDLADRGCRCEVWPPASPGRRSGESRLFRGVPIEAVEQFVGSFRAHPGYAKAQPGPVLAHLEAGRDAELAVWDVLFPSVRPDDSSRQLVFERLGFRLHCQRRKKGDRSDATTWTITNQHRVSSRGVERAGLSAEQVKQARDEYKRSKSPDQDRGSYPDHIYRTVRGRPLMVVHLLAIGDEDDDLSEREPVVAWSMSLPQSDREQEAVEYVVNPTWYARRYGDERDEEGIENA